MKSPLLSCMHNPSMGSMPIHAFKNQWLIDRLIDSFIHSFIRTKFDHRLRYWSHRFTPSNYQDTIAGYQTNLLISAMLYPSVPIHPNKDFQLSYRAYIQFVIPNMMISMTDVSGLEMSCNQIWPLARMQIYYGTCRYTMLDFTSWSLRRNGISSMHRSWSSLWLSAILISCLLSGITNMIASYIAK